MAWIDELPRVTLPDGRKFIGASFRGVPFFVAAAERSIGRRTVVDELPFRDDENVEDIGRRANTFRVEGYVIGSDYLADRDALIVALQDVPGPGELVHPYYGRRRAICARGIARESVAEGGMARFQITFENAPTRPSAPAEDVDLAAQVDADADAALADSDAEFVGRYLV